jgi:hypothetical protein
MKASDLLKALVRVMDEHGDLDVRIADWSAHPPIDKDGNMTRYEPVGFITRETHKGETFLEIQ